MAEADAETSDEFGAVLVEELGQRSGERPVICWKELVV